MDKETLELLYLPALKELRETGRLLAPGYGVVEVTRKGRLLVAFSGAAHTAFIIGPGYGVVMTEVFRPKRRREIFSSPKSRVGVYEWTPGALPGDIRDLIEEIGGKTRGDHLLILKGEGHHPLSGSLLWWGLWSKAPLANPWFTPRTGKWIGDRTKARMFPTLVSILQNKEKGVWDAPEETRRAISVEIAKKIFGTFLAHWDKKPRRTAATDFDVLKSAPHSWLANRGIIEMMAKRFAYSEPEWKEFLQGVFEDVPGIIEEILPGAFGDEVRSRIHSALWGGVRNTHLIARKISWRWEKHEEINRISREIAQQFFLESWETPNLFARPSALVSTRKELGRPDKRRLSKRLREMAREKKEELKRRRDVKIPEITISEDIPF